MAYEIFARKTPRLGRAVMSFSKIGSVVFNQTAARTFQESKIKDVLLLWDSESKQLALRRVEDADDVRAYTIRFNDKGNGASFSAKTFLDHVGIQYQRAERHQMPISINPESETFLELKVPSALFVAEDSSLSLRKIEESTSSPSSSAG